LDADQVDHLALGGAADDEKRAMPQASVAYADGMRLSGNFGGIRAGRLLLECPAAIETLSLPLTGLATIHFHHSSPEAAPADGPLKMELAGGQMHGRLLPARSDDGQTCLLWQPLASSTASALRADAAARIDFGRAVRPLKSQAAGTQHDTVYLREGDVFKCQVGQIDATGVAFRTSAAAGRAPDERVKAVELGVQLRQAGLPADKLARLLTLPRLQKDDPPMHILCSKNGDYLRGRLIEVGEETIRFEVGGSQREFPRARVARIIWLHPEELDTGDEAEHEPLETAGLVQAVQADGTRLTFAASQIDAESIRGESQSLGECRMLLEDLGELLVGGRMLQSAATLPYQQWKLTPATVPVAFQPSADGDSPVDTGKDSAWVGRTAPDFDLELVDGARFRLSQQKGKIVVLDFWATWCAPCRQGLPKVAEAVAGFEAEDIRLVTVNLQEPADAVSDALKRMELDVAVALDHDGAVAERYGASAIPYTVVVGRDGTVARVFVGTSPDIDARIKAALEELRSPAKSE
ncbi:MAG TPA: TlpA disulfide reductase family protein, partial [Pirellulales bacterium]